MRRIRWLAALGLAVALACLSVAPVAAASPRAGEATWTPALVLQCLSDQVAQLFGGWVRSLAAPGKGAGDPDGAPAAADPTGGAAGPDATPILDSGSGGAAQPDA